MSEQQQIGISSIVRESSGKISSTRIVLLATVFVILGLMIASFVVNQSILEIPATVLALLGAVFTYSGANKYTETKGAK